MNDPAPMVPVRYCPQCGRLGDVAVGFSCCPLGIQARMVPKIIAEQARVGFHIAHYGARMRPTA